MQMVTIVLTKVIKMVKILALVMTKVMTIIIKMKKATTSINVTK